MDALSALFDKIEGPDDQARNSAYAEILGRSNTPDDVYDQWPRFAAMLGHRNNHIRSIAGQLYAHFAASDPQGRVWDLWDQWTAVASDEKFVTARHTLQGSPRFARAGDAHRQRLLAYYRGRFETCAAEKNTTLIRYDLQVCLRAVYDQAPDPDVVRLARELIATEPDPKYQTKYRAVWRGVPE